MNHLYDKKPSACQAAFALLELIVVLLIIAILAAVVIPKFLSDDDYSSRSVAAELIVHLQYAQQLAMNHTGKQVTVNIGSNSISIQQDGSPIRSLQGELYPYTFPHNVTISPITSLTFTSEGTLAGSGVTLMFTPLMGSNICIETSGYAWLC